MVRRSDPLSATFRRFRRPFLCLFLTALAAGPAAGAGVSIPEPLHGFDLAAMDRGVDPCQDFYQYACGGWFKSHPIPGDQSSWSRFDQLIENNQAILRQILEQAATDRPGRSAVEQKIGDYYASCMDEAAIEARGTVPLAPALDLIASLKEKGDLAAVLARLHELGVPVLFAFNSEQDLKDASRVIAVADQGGMGLPSREYYLGEDAAAVELRNKYVAHLQKLLELLGDAPEKAAAGARAALRIETGLARAALPPADRRDPAKVYHPMPATQLQALSPSFGWNRYLAGVGLPRLDSLDVAVPAFFREVEAEIGATSVDEWKSYLRARLASAAAPMLPAAFVREDFEFSEKTVNGVRELKPRFKRCIELTDRQLGEALGQKYVEVAFGEASRKRMDELVAALMRALGRDIRELDWMSEPTKKEALAKLARIVPKIGYPRHWRDYGALQVARGDALGNWERGEAFELHRQLAKIGKPVDKDEWPITPPTVNAYYSVGLNDINFPAGILQPPFFDVRLDDAINYGAIGSVIGHELTHGFDDHGSQFDGAGNLRNWWTPTDGKEFARRTSCLADQYSRYSAVDDVKVNGRLTLGENTADEGGTRIGYLALHDVLGGKEPPKIDGFTADQRFFLGWSQIWCESVTPEFARRLALSNPHAPSRYRVDGVFANMPEFRRTYGCKEGQPMAPANTCRVW
jgi:putative endopeptidase